MSIWFLSEDEERAVTIELALRFGKRVSDTAEFTIIAQKTILEVKMDADTADGVVEQLRELTTDSHIDLAGIVFRFEEYDHDLYRKQYHLVFKAIDRYEESTAV